MNVISLSAVDLGIAASLVVMLALLSQRMRLGITSQVLVAAVRTTIQLLLVGLVLEVLFANVNLWFMTGIAMIMLLVAGREVMARQTHRYRGAWGFAMGTVSMFVSTFTVLLLTLTVIIGNHPWYTPQYAIPLLGMMLGNTMTGIALGLERLTSAATDKRAEIDARLAYGETGQQAISRIRRDSMRAGMLPIINSMAAAGIVSLPGMMTGQILAGSPPLEAVKYQILIMFLITAGTGFGTVTAVWLGSRRLFDRRDRLRLERLHINAGD